jgi:hypothetical protein
MLAPPKLASSLACDPAALEPDERSGCRAFEKGHVLDEQQDTERQHPQAQNREEAEDSREYEQKPYGNSDPAGGRSPKPPKRPGGNIGQQLFQPLQLSLKPFLVLIGHR